jgi:hypothetical protein
LRKNGDNRIPKMRPGPACTLQPLINKGKSTDLLPSAKNEAVSLPDRLPEPLPHPFIISYNQEKI